MKRYDPEDKYHGLIENDLDGDFVCYDDIAVDLELARDLREFVTKYQGMKSHGGTCSCHLCDAIRLVEKWTEKLCLQKIESKP
jgi:hypothetical protein